MKKSRKYLERPSIELLEEEISRVRYKQRYRSVLKSTIYSLITVAAVAVLVATLWLPVMQTYGTSMAPTLNNGEIILSVKTKKLNQGDIIAFYFNNKILVKRIIAEPGQWVDIDEDGNVYVNEHLLVEPYLSEKSLGEVDIDLPYQVPESRYFVMGDHRSVSVDSRKKENGCIAEEQIVGTLEFCIWPLGSFGLIK